MNNWTSNFWVTTIVGPLVVTVLGTIAAELILRGIPSAGPPAPGSPSSTTFKQFGVATDGGSLSQTGPVTNTYNYFGGALESSERAGQTDNRHRLIGLAIVLVLLFVALLVFSLVLLRFLDLVVFGVSSMAMMTIAVTALLIWTSRRVWNRVTKQGAVVALSSTLVAAATIAFWVFGSGQLGKTTQTAWELHAEVSAPDYPGGWFSWNQLDVKLGETGKPALLLNVLGLIYLILALTYVWTQVFCWAGALRSPPSPPSVPPQGIARRTMQFKQFNLVHLLFVISILGLSLFLASGIPYELLAGRSTPPGVGNTSTTSKKPPAPPTKKPTLPSTVRSLG